MRVIDGGFHISTKDLEDKLRRADFSVNTDLKVTLGNKMFPRKASGRIRHAVPISDDEADLVTAAAGIVDEDPWKKRLKSFTDVGI